MSFEDLAKRMGAQTGGEGAPAGDPDKIIAEAVTAGRRMSSISDLLLGLILLAGGALVLVLSLSLLIQGQMPSFTLTVASVAAIIFGLARILRGLTGAGEERLGRYEDPAALLRDINQKLERLAEPRPSPLEELPEQELLVTERADRRRTG